MQAVADEHDTAERDAEGLVPGTGTWSIDHVFPSHTSASGASPSKLVVEVDESPAATQLTLEAHDIPLNWANTAVAGTGTSASVQVEPFSDSTSGTSMPAPFIA
jgi:hypothetical protein